MPITVPTCPHCGAALVVTRFAATAVCAYCGATVKVDPDVVSARRFRDAWRSWNQPETGGGDRDVTVGDTRWTIKRTLARGEISDVYLAKRARWPPELVILKVLRNPDDAPLLDREWRALETLHRSPAAEGLNLAIRVPYPIARGPLSAVYRHAPGFEHTFEAVRAAHPQGIEPVASIWVWRRVLEILSVVRRAGLAHGAVSPSHLLIENGEHGVRLVGFSRAGTIDSKLTTSADITMSARSVSYLLSPDRVPAALGELLRRAESGEVGDDPWRLREQVGEVGKVLFGPPAYHPIAMP